MSLRFVSLCFVSLCRFVPAAQKSVLKDSLNPTMMSQRFLKSFLEDKLTCCEILILRCRQAALTESAATAVIFEELEPGQRQAASVSAMRMAQTEKSNLQQQCERTYLKFTQGAIRRTPMASRSSIASEGMTQVSKMLRRTRLQSKT